MLLQVMFPKEQMQGVVNSLMLRSLNKEGCVAVAAEQGASSSNSVAASVGGKKDSSGLEGSGASGLTQAPATVHTSQSSSIQESHIQDQLNTTITLDDPNEVIHLKNLQLQLIADRPKLQISCYGICNKFTL